MNFSQINPKELKKLSMKFKMFCIKICKDEEFDDSDSVYIFDFKPYLFPLSNMTEKQKDEYQYITERWMNDPAYSISDSIDWLNKNNFDYRGLIEKGLAIPILNPFS